MKIHYLRNLFHTACGMNSMKGLRVAFKLEAVTCTNCKKSVVYKKAVVEDKDEDILFKQ